MKKYMIIEHFYHEKVKALYQRFASEGRLLPEGVVYLDSWMNEDLTVCYQLMEAVSRERLQLWMDRWKDFARFEVVPVIDSAKAKSIALAD